MIRQYMPGGHRRFLEDVGKGPNIHDLIQSYKDQNLAVAYHGTLEQLKAFREAHIQVVTRYIVLPARRPQKDGTTPDQLKGTAGSAILPFLKLARDETLGSIEATGSTGISKEDLKWK